MPIIEYHFKATKSCNLACPYCHEKLNKKGSKVLSPHGMNRIFNKILLYYKSINKKPKIRLCYTGGEILTLGKEWMRTVLDLQKRVLGEAGIKYSTSIQSNLTLVDQEWIALFKANNIEVGTSLDPFAPTRPFKNNGELSTGTVIEKLILLTENKLGASAILVITRHNFDKAKVIYKALNQARLNFHTLPLHPETIKYCPQLAISPQEYARFLIELLDEYIKPNNLIRISVLDDYISLVKHGYLEEKVCVCSARRNCISDFLFFENNGEAFYCGCFCQPELMLGNIFRDSISKIYSRLKNKSILKMLASRYNKIKAICKGCEFLYICNGGCPSFAYQEGDMLSKSPFYCAVNRAVFNYLKKHMVNKRK